MKPNRKNSLHDRLHELSKAGSVSPFSKTYYEFIADELEELEDAADVAGISIVFQDLLATETRYHRCLNRVADGERISFEEFQELTIKRRTNLERIAAATVAISPASQQLRGIQHLVLAECYYHLRRSVAVVEELEKAIECGVSHPVVHFALGYNIYAMGVELHTTIDANSKSTVTTDPVAFQHYCLAAVTAFEQGLTGTAFDMQIYWWIGQVFQAAGMGDAAADIQDYLRTGDDSWDDDDEESLDYYDELPSISKTEIRQAGEALHGKFSVNEVMGYGFEDK